MATYEYVVDSTWPGPGSPGAGVWHFRNTQDGITSLQDCVDVIQTFYEDISALELHPVGTSWSGSGEVVDVDTREISPVTPWTQTQNSGVGNFAGPLMVCLTLATTQATRSGRGRKFIGPLASNCVSADGTPASVVISGVQGAGATLVANSSALTQSAIGVYSRTDGVFRDLVSTRVRDTFAVLRSRRD